MDSTVSSQFSGFSPEILNSLLVPGVSERWAAVQAQLHPQLVALSEQLREAGLRRFPREWPLYDFVFRSLRYVNHPDGRAPIDNYYMGLDRPPRGCGVYIVVSGAERSIIVALQLATRQRKDDLRQVWERSRALWLPLIERTNDVRFAERERPKRRRAKSPEATIQPETWMDRYLATPGTTYLLAGMAYRWDDPQVARPEFANQIIEDVLSLFPLNEAIMEQAEEALEPHHALRLREQRSVAYATGDLPPIETIVERIHARGFALSDGQIRAYHLALRTKPLVILTGISGTGKTRLTRLYADAFHNITDSRQPNEHYLLVAVQPDWHNARDLLGYYNTLTSTFHPTPFLRFLLRAAADPAALYFVCLDEMNLARPEYYLAPILSALETEDHLIDLGIPTAEAKTVGGEMVQNPFRLPLNIRITGTVNVDESTHTLSDKLLDRANLIELTDVDLDAFRATYSEPIDETAWQVLVAAHVSLARAHQPFGYRTISEILRYVEHARGVLPANQALDQQIKQKLLPKLRGDDSPRLRRALTELLELTLGLPQERWNRAALVDASQLAAAPYPDSAEKLRRMLERLDTEGFTDFYG